MATFLAVWCVKKNEWVFLSFAVGKASGGHQRPNPGMEKSERIRSTPASQRGLKIARSGPLDFRAGPLLAVSSACDHSASERCPQNGADSRSFMTW